MVGLEIKRVHLAGAAVHPQEDAGAFAVGVLGGVGGEALIQPDIEQATTPAADKRSQSRREKECFMECILSSFSGGSQTRAGPRGSATRR